MLKQLDEFAKPVNFLHHFHCGNDVISIVASGGRVFKYFNDVKVGCYKLSTNSFQIVTQFMQLGKDLKLLESANSCFEKSGILNVTFAGKFVLGILQRTTLIFFKNDFKDLLLKGEVYYVESFIAKTFDLSSMLSESSYVVYIALLGLGDGTDIHILSNELYLALFGLEAFKFRHQVLLLFLSDGQMWYLLLKDFSIPKYLFSFNDECIKVFVDETGLNLTVLTKEQCLFKFIAKNETFQVTKSWNNVSTEFFPNICNLSTTNFHSCTPSLCVKDKSVIYITEVQYLQLNHEEQLDRLRTELITCDLEKRALLKLKQECLNTLKTFETFANFSATEAKPIEIVFTPKTLEVHWLSSTLSFRPFSVVLLSSNSSEAFFCNENHFLIPAKTALKYSNVMCLFYEKEMWFKCTYLQYNILNFVKVEHVKCRQEFKFKSKLTFNTAKVTEVMQNLLSTTNLKTEYDVEITNTLARISCTFSDSESVVFVYCNNSFILNQFCDCFTEEVKKLLTL